MADMSISQTPSLDCLIVPLFEGNLLLPQSVVVEVISRGDQSLVFSPPVKALPWLKGHFSWREQRLPVLSLMEVADAAQASRITRFLVVHNLYFDPQKAQQGPAFYAIEVRGIPHSIKIHRQDIRPWDAPAQSDDLIAMRVKASGVVCLIPHFERMAQRLGEHSDV